MIVDVVSPTPFALLRRAKNFEYKEADVVLRKFSEYEDPVQALTDECRRVLRCISSTNQSATLTDQATTSKDTSWSRFEDLGFGSLADELNRDGPANSESAYNRKPQQPQGLRTTPRSGEVDLGRPTTPSWADFLSSGFADDQGGKAPRPLLLPPDKILPPISQSRGPSSHSNIRSEDGDSMLEPGELASIIDVDLDDSFWWAWITSLAGEEPTERKAAFGRCALIETTIRGNWLIMEEQVKGAADEPAEGAYIAEKKGFFSFSRRGKLSRKKSTNKSLAPPQELYRKGNVSPMSKTSIAPNQHARIQAAAAALKQSNTENAAPNETVRRGRADDNASQRTASVFTLQPVIVNEASPAMKWASQYDKGKIRAAYLGNEFAGRGTSNEMLHLPTNGMAPSTNGSITPTPTSPTRAQEAATLPRDQSNLSRQSDLTTKDLPPAPEGTGTPLQQEKLEQLAPKTPPHEYAPPPYPPAPETVVPQAPPAPATEAAQVPLPSVTPYESPAPQGAQQQFFVAPEQQPPVVPQEQTPSVPEPPPPTVPKDEEPAVERPSQGEVSLEQVRTTISSPEASPTKEHRKLKKKEKPRGFKGMFGKKKPDPSFSVRSPPIQNQSAVAAARAALEGRTKQAQPSKPEFQGPSQAAAGKRFSGIPRKGVNSPTAASAPARKISEDAPAPDAYDIPPVNRHHREDRHPDTLSRVDTNERLQADQEFSRFDQGPLDDQPAFVGEPDSPAVQQEDFEPPVMPVAVAEGPETPGTDSDQSKEEDLTRQISPSQDRWAQIRKNAAERAAARQSEEKTRPRAPTDRTTDDGETSGEESKSLVMRRT